MKSLLAGLAPIGLMAAVAIEANIPGPLLKADRNRGERHEKVSLAAVADLPTFAGRALAIDARAIERAISEEYAAAHGRLAALPTFAGQAAAIVPDPTLTPGAVRTTNIGEVCSTSTRELRHWDRARDDHVMAEYGLLGGPHPQYEVDHLIPLCLGGADSDANLWPEPRRSIEPIWNAERKDELEARMCALACSGALDVAEAQRMIAEDWTAAYGRFFREPGGEARRQDSVSPSRQPGDTQ